MDRRYGTATKESNIIKQTAIAEAYPKFIEFALLKI